MDVLTVCHVRAIKKKLSFNGSFLKTRQETENIWVINQHFLYSIILRNQDNRIQVAAHFPETEEFRERTIDMAKIHVNQQSGEFTAVIDLDSSFSILAEDIVDAIYSAFFGESAT